MTDVVDFPLWKRGIEGDSTRIQFAPALGKSPLSPLFKGGNPDFNDHRVPLAIANSAFFPLTLQGASTIIKKITVLALILGSAVATNALADTTGLYAYAAAGRTDSDRKAQADTVITNLGITAFTSSADAGDSGYKLQIGYRFNRHLALEGGYVDLGRSSYRANSTAPIVATRTGYVETDGWSLAAVGRLPLTASLALTGKLGLLAYDLQFRCFGGAGICGNPVRGDSGVKPTYGLGLDWDLGANWFARAEYEVYRNIGSRFDTLGSTGTSQADIALASIGIGYRF